MISGLGRTYGINASSGLPEKKFCFNLLNSLHYNAENNYLFLNRKDIIKFKANNKNVNFPTRFYLGSISDGFSANKCVSFFSR